MKYKFLRDAKFWTLVADFFIGLAALGISYITDPIAFKVASYIVGTAQPIIFLVITEMFVADAQALKRYQALLKENPSLTASAAKHVLPPHFQEA